MTNTLILVFHPDLAASKANAALAAAAGRVDGVEIVDVQSEYPDGRIDMFGDGGREADRLARFDRIVLQFPLQWYSAPPLLKAWQNAVLTRMFYIHPDTEGQALAGKAMAVAVTAGNVAEAYRSGGANMFTMEALLAPLMATAHRCGLVWEDSFVVYRADKLAAHDLAVAGAAYADRLRRAPVAPMSAPFAMEA